MGETMRILLIDGKKSRSDKTKKLLERAIPSCSVSIKDNGLEGVAEMHHSDCDIAVLNDNLPDGSAKDILSLINNSEPWRPVVIISDTKTKHDYEFEPLSEYCITITNDEAFEKTLALAVIELNKRHLLYRKQLILIKELGQTQTNQHIAETASNSNHKINNPLMTILGNTQLLLRDCNECDEKTIMRLEKIEQAAKKIQEITLDLANNIGIEANPVESANKGK
jgi:signal transduction histidine kinase